MVVIMLLRGWTFMAGSSSVRCGRHPSDTTVFPQKIFYDLPTTSSSWACVF